MTGHSRRQLPQSPQKVSFEGKNVSRNIFQQIKKSKYKKIVNKYKKLKCQKKALNINEVVDSFRADSTK